MLRFLVKLFSFLLNHFFSFSVQLQKVPFFHFQLKVVPLRAFDKN